MRRYMFAMLAAFILLIFGFSETVVAGEQRSRGKSQSRSRKSQSKPERKKNTTRSRSTTRESKPEVKKKSDDPAPVRSTPSYEPEREEPEERERVRYETEEPSEPTYTTPSYDSSTTSRSRPENSSDTPSRSRYRSSGTRYQSDNSSGSSSSDRITPRIYSRQFNEIIKERIRSRGNVKVMTASEYEAYVKKHREKDDSTSRTRVRMRQGTSPGTKTAIITRESTSRSRRVKEIPSAGRVVETARRDGAIVEYKHQRSRDDDEYYKYNRRVVVRNRTGSFDAERSRDARIDKNRVGRISLTYTNTKDTGPEALGRSRGADGKYKRFVWAAPVNIENNFDLVDGSGSDTINRHYLIDNDGCWGHSPEQYNGRNWHFYSVLVEEGYYFESDPGLKQRRYLGDPDDSYYGWSASRYFPEGLIAATHYFEPNYAFSFTFNHGYENGYIDGFLQGIDDWNEEKPYYSKYKFVNGYFSELGPCYEYVNGYEQGFDQGYYAGFAGMPYGWENFGFGDFSQYPIIYDFDYDYLTGKTNEPSKKQ